MRCGPDSIVEVIALRLRSRRVELGLTLNQLADTAEVSRRTLINIEQGTVNCSVAVLSRLGEALDLHLSELVRIPDDSAAKLGRSEAAAVVWVGPHGGICEQLIGAGRYPRVDLMRLTLEFGEECQLLDIASVTSGLVRVLNGHVAVDFVASRPDLHAGDSASFPRIPELKLSNLGAQTAVLMLAISVGSQQVHSFINDRKDI